MNELILAGADHLTPAEQLLLAAILSGRRAELKGGVVRASVLRDLATEIKSDWPLPPVGINLHDATIEGTLDLEGCAVSRPLVFLRCRFDAKGDIAGALRLRDSRLKRIAMYECQVNGAIKADRINIESAFFLTGSTIEGMVRLRGATIGEALAMDGVTINNARDTAFLADGMRLGGPWVLRAATIKGQVRFAGARIGGGLLWEEAKLGGHAVAVNADGAIGESVWVLRRTRIDGALRFRGMTLGAMDAQELELNTAVEGFNGRGANIGSDLLLDGAKVTGGVRLGRAHIAGELSAKGATLTGQDQEWALAAAGLLVDQGVSLAAAKIKGGITFAGARLGQGLSASNIEIEGRGRAIEADVIHIGGNWIMRGARITGSVRFAGARIEGQIGFTESKIQGSGDLAIRADGAHVRGGWFMGRSEIHGLVRLPAARLGNEMRLRATKLHVMHGPALFASGVKIARELVLDGGFTTCGGIVLDHAEIEGMLELSGSRIQSAALGRGGTPRRGAYDEVLDSRYDEVAISLVDARLDRLVMPDSAADRPRGIVDLSRARVGSYEDTADSWPPPLGKRHGDTRGRSSDGREIDHLVLDGFVYDYLENPAGLPTRGENGPRRLSHLDARAAHMRTRWLEGQSENDLRSHFKPQVWVQLARVLSAQGYHDDAREIGIARRRRHRRAASASRSAKLQGWFLDVFALYGYNPWRTVLWMAACILAFAGLWSYAASDCAQADCKDESVFVMALKGNFGQDDTKATANYPGFASLAYSFDVFVPFVNFGFEDHWRPNLAYRPIAELPSRTVGGLSTPGFTLTAGGVLYCLYVVEMLIGLVLTSLAVTGFTGMLRGDDEGR